MSLTAQFVRNLQRFRLVTFDVTDTLIRLNDPINQYIQTAAECGITGVERAKMEQCFSRQFKRMSKEHTNFGCKTPGMSWQSWWRHLVVNTFQCADANIPKEKLEALAEQLLSLFRTSACWTHVDAAGELVQHMRSAGKYVGIISNFDPSLHQVLDAMGFKNKFDFILTSYEAGIMKPFPGIFEIPIRRLNLQPEQALHIGNKLDMDYLGARNSGWSSLLVQPQSDSESKSLVAAPSSGHTFGSLADMLQALETKEIAW